MRGLGLISPKVWICKSEESGSTSVMAWSGTALARPLLIEGNEIHDYIATAFALGSIQRLSKQACILDR